MCVCCVLHVHVCVVVCICALVCAFMCVSAFRMVDTNLQIYLQNMCLHVSVITQAQNNINSFSFGKFLFLLHAYNWHNLMSLYVHLIQGCRKQSADGQARLDVSGEATNNSCTRSAWQYFGPRFLASYLAVRRRSHCTSASNWGLPLLCFPDKILRKHDFLQYPFLRRTATKATTYTMHV